MLKSNQLSQKILLAFLLAAHIPYLWLCLYNHPSADDFAYAASAIRNGFWNAYINDYFQWNGRYTHNLLVFSSPLVWGSFGGYQLVAFTLFFLNYFCLWFFIKKVSEKKMSPVEQHIITAVISLLYVFNAPALAESFYWYTGAVSYQLPQSISLLYFGLLYDYFNKKNILQLILLCLLIIAIMGCNEVIMLLFLGFHTATLLYCIMIKSSNKKIWILLFIVTCIAASFMIFAPGNACRASNFTGTHNLMHSLTMTSFQIIRFTFSWISTPLLIASLFFIPMSFRLNEIAFFRNRFYLHPVFTFLALPAVIFLCVFPAYWNMGILGQHRTLNTAYFFFIIIWFMNMHNLILSWKESSLVATFLLYGKYTGIIAMVMLGGLLFTNNGYNGLEDIIADKAKIYDAEMNNRYQVIALSKKMNGTDVQLKPLSHPPKTIFFIDITTDADNWLNKCYENYFGVEKIKINVKNTK